MNKKIKAWSVVKSQYAEESQRALLDVIAAQRAVHDGCGQSLLKGADMLPIGKGIKLGAAYVYGRNEPVSIYTEMYEQGAFVQRGQMFGLLWDGVSLRQAKKLVRALRSVRPRKLIKEWEKQQ